MKKSLGNTALWTALATLSKIGLGLVFTKIFALYFGSLGIGQAANFMTLITVLGVLAGGGIFNGVTKFVAQYQDDPPRLRTVLATSSLIVLGFSALLALLFCLFARPLSLWLFNDAQFQPVIYCTALIQLGIAVSNYLLAILKGYRDAKGNSLATLGGLLLSAIGFGIGIHFYGYQGALIGLALVPALSFLPALLFVKRQLGAQPFHDWRTHASSEQAKQLMKFSVMVLITTATLPVTYITLRNLLNEAHGLEAVGLWQGTAKISDAYLQFITATFPLYLLPTFAKLSEKQAIKAELLKSLRLIVPALCALSLGIYVLRDWIILLLYSPEFLPMKPLFKWQLFGDVCKVIAYIFGYLIIAKGALRYYLLAEISQLALLVCTGFALIPRFGAEGATQAYALTYALYLLGCVVGFICYLRRQPAS